MGSGIDWTAQTPDLPETFHTYATLIVAMDSARSQRLGSKLPKPKIVTELMAAYRQPASAETRRLLAKVSRYLRTHRNQLLQDAHNILNATLAVTQRRYGQGWPGDLHAKVVGEPRGIVYGLKSKVKDGGTLTTSDLQALCTVIETANSVRIAATELAKTLKQKRHVAYTRASKFDELHVRIQRARAALATLVSRSLEPWKDEQCCLEQLIAAMPAHQATLDSLITAAKPGTVDWTEFDQQAASLKIILREGHSLCQRILSAEQEHAAAISRLKPCLDRLYVRTKKLRTRLEQADHNHQDTLYWLRKLENVAWRFHQFAQQATKWPALQTAWKTYSVLLAMYDDIERAATGSEQGFAAETERLPDQIVFYKKNVEFFFCKN